MSREANQFLHIATVLPVRRWWHVIPFLRMASRVQEQAKESQGAVTYSVRAEFRRKRFYALSIWEDRASVDSFFRMEPHATAIKRFQDWAGQGAAFAEWTSSDDSQLGQSREKTPEPDLLLQA
jgi:heme-degrading monooxygenase HmoA